MAALSLVAGNYGRGAGEKERGSFDFGYFGKDFLGNDLLTFMRVNGYNEPKGFRGWRKGLGNGFHVSAKAKKWKKHDYPWPDNPDANNNPLSYLSHFKPLSEKPKPVTLPFEKPLIDLEKRIIYVRRMADETGLDFSDQI